MGLTLCIEERRYAAKRLTAAARLLSEGRGNQKGGMTRDAADEAIKRNCDADAAHDVTEA
jgi:hypothetical protein